MISYLGVSIDELLQIFDASFAFSDNRPDRELVLPIEVEEYEGDEDEAALAAEDDESDEELDDEDEELADILVDDEGQLHAYGETVSFAAEAAIEFLTDYILTDEVEQEWLTLDQARGALLALRILLPELDEIPEVECAYKFDIARDPSTGYPTQLTMAAIEPGQEVKASLSFDASAYTGIVLDSSSLAEMFASAGVPEDDRSLLTDIISEGVLSLSQEQCGIVLDTKNFVSTLVRAAAELKFSPEEGELPN